MIYRSGYMRALVLGVVCLFLTGYSYLGIQQASGLFSEDEAQLNLDVWSVATLVFFCLAVACFIAAWRLRRPIKKI
jgi:amino acid transporter